MQTQFANAVTQKENGTRLGGSILRAGGLVAFPTETVYGLGANGWTAMPSAAFLKPRAGRATTRSSCMWRKRTM